MILLVYLIVSGKLLDGINDKNNNNF